MTKEDKRLKNPRMTSRKYFELMLKYLSLDKMRPSNSLEKELEARSGK